MVRRASPRDRHQRDVNGHNHSKNQAALLWFSLITLGSRLDFLMQKRLEQIKRRWGDNSGLGFLKGATIDAVHVLRVCVCR